MSIDQSVEKTSYEKLKDLVLEGHILPGQRITEIFLAEQLNKSRIPVREAVQQLIHEGFIERTGKNGYQIKEYNEQDIIDLYNYREALDGMLARLFTQRMDVSQLYYLEMNLEAMKENLNNFDQATFSKIDLEFHRIIARGARNPHMKQQHDLILEKVLYIADRIYLVNEEKQANLIDRSSFEDTFNQHSMIYKAIQEKDPDAAEQAARKSVQNGLRKALLVMSRQF
ncbi:MULTISPECIES: GntR family transcriptional regulator [unclassified Oceanispirochaeta]|uniref:GntR family transcriptional regulator n=1 Tax=unclassified Oceanispirochaeta TaxID=2635722 RepID=UPI001314EC86|nr:MULTISPECIES: GntR family transcriptional regulator [unclassified Oceanispirochaeta]MBF9014288.1 GntR family transcriptional regulator [Oceanispirochaeta sp. M2]NPD71174.1 GntR family transcriptional regulator [Oceanispirochaeta sp. M1]